VYHLDLYRLSGPADLTNIGWDEIVGARALVIVEWPERAGDRLPDDAVRIHLAHVPGDPERRALSVTGTGRTSAVVVDGARTPGAEGAR
ncbi:MAG TPA: tRNA (adenosine(37)-N6)-threonylcarbamoyltransferase complex ATPase subunit type 1 TsaE, partial [Gemmatimonadaceae bacterium]|nr:tRNA (adenosine(37)-N6)-threonylcarbamoyltransferase complex ATPase subunit type 1 TsaE [Gemmatimonadaceae bacterium]